MEIKLTGLSLVSFMMAREGDVLEIRRVTPRIGRSRATTGPMSEAYLVYKDKSKIGKIPNKILEKHGKSTLKSNCRAKKVDKESNTFIIEL